MPQPGASLGLELHAAADADFRAMVLPVVSVLHLVVTPHAWEPKRLNEIGRSGDCNIDIACAEAAWTDAADAVAKYLMPRGEGTAALCTGTLINNMDGAPRFLGLLSRGEEVPDARVSVYDHVHVQHARSARCVPESSGRVTAGSLRPRRGATMRA
jgi:hypothetical protein